MFFTYVLYSKTYNKIYISQSKDLKRRMYEQNNGLLSGYTKKFKPWEVIYTELFETIHNALEREKQLKSQNGREFIWNLVKEKGLQVRYGKREPYKIELKESKNNFVQKPFLIIFHLDDSPAFINSVRRKS